MTENLKYSKYFLNELPPEQREQGFGKRPFIFIQAQYAPKMPETSFKKMIPEDQRKNMLFLGREG